MFRRILILSSICIFNGSSRIDNQKKAFSWLATDNNRLIKLIYVKGEIKKDAIRDCDIAWRGLRECLLIDSNPPRGHQCPCIIWGLYTHHWFCMLLILLYYGGNITHYFSYCKRFCQKIDYFVVQGPPGSCFGSLNRRRRKQVRPILVSLR